MQRQPWMQRHCGMKHRRKTLLMPICPDTGVVSCTRRRFRQRLDGQQANNYAGRLGTSARNLADAQTESDFTRGIVKETGRTLDVALESDGFFEVVGPNGSLYTRSGSFHATPDGRLVTVDGLEVMGTRGPVQIPPNTSSEAIVINRDGRLTAGGVEFDELKRVTFDNPQRLVPSGASLFDAPAGVEANDSAEGVLQGYVEGSNVAYMDELVGIMVASRQYEAAQRVISMID